MTTATRSSLCMQGDHPINQDTGKAGDTQYQAQIQAEGSPSRTADALHPLLLFS